MAEDNAANRKLAVAMLDLLGYATDTAANGAEAVDAWNRSSYDAVLMDCRMPEMDGFRATAEIRAREASPKHTPIIAMTADAMEGDRQRCFDAGMDDYIAKPVRLESLAAVLERWTAVDAPKPQPEPPATASSGEPFDAGAESPLDATVMADLRTLEEGRGKDRMFEMVSTFLEGAGSHLKDLRLAAARADEGAILRTAHALVGSTATFGARRMAELCRHLETLASEGRLDDIGQTLTRIEAEFDRVSAALRAEFPGSGEAGS